MTMSVSFSLAPAIVGEYFFTHDGIFHADEIVLDGTVEVTDKGTLLFTSDDEYVVVLEGVADVAQPGQHIMVVGDPYKKDGNYYLSVTSYTYLFKNGHAY